MKSREFKDEQKLDVRSNFFDLLGEAILLTFDVFLQCSLLLFEVLP